MSHLLRKKIKLVISDFHLSRGKWLKDGRRNPLEDFTQDERFKEFLDHHSMGGYAEAEVELIINGDFFDPLAIIPLPEISWRGGKLKRLEYPLEVEEGSALDKFKTIIEGHPISFEAMRTFLRRGKRIIFRWGNHDVSILWPQVQELLRTTLMPPTPEQIEFQQKPYIFDRICIDHGHQHETLNHFDEQNIFIERKTKGKVRRIQNLPFGSFFVLGFLNRIKLQRSYINQVHPFSTFLGWSFYFDPLFFILNGFRAAWFFFKMRFITHPMRFTRWRKTVLLILESFRRPMLENVAQEILCKTGTDAPAFDTLIMGHNHQPKMRIFPGGKLYINTGTWIPITSLDMSTLGHRVLRTYALIEYIDGKACASLKIWNGQPQIIDDFT